MKKFLSLVMALIMVMSLVTVASAADYKDAADIDKAEAVDVMSAVGVFQGSAGKFNPKAILNRAEAAKLIAYLDLGEAVAEALPAVQSFSDVPTTHWAAKFIAYCADEGYINGVGNGKFDPAGKLTGYQFGKLLLCVLGYDYKIESFTGANWSIAVAKLMQANDINKDVKAAPSAELTREDAAQYCLNALQATTVDYADKGTTITVGGIDIVTGAKAATVKSTTNETVGTAISTTKTAAGAYTVELGEQLYEADLVLTKSQADAFGRKGNKWDYDNETVGTYATAAKVVFNSLATEADVAKAMKGLKIDGYKIDADTKTLGNDSSSILGTTWDSTKSTAKCVAGLTANNKVVEIYTSKGNVSEIHTLQYDIAEVYAIHTNKDGDVTYTLKTANNMPTAVDKADPDKKDTISFKTAPVKKDVVTYFFGSDAVFYIYPTTTITGVVTAMKDSDYVVVDGVKYPVAPGVSVDVKKDAQELVIDQFGIVVDGDDVDKDSDVIYVAHNWTVKDAYGNDVKKAQVVDQAGAVTEVTVHKDSPVDVGVFTYYTASNDTVWFNDVDSDDAGRVYRNTADAAVVGLKDTDKKLQTVDLYSEDDDAYYYFASDVTFVNVKDSGADLKVKTSAGVQNVAYKTLADSYVVMKDGEIITVFVPDAKSATVNKDDVLFIADTYSYSYAADAKGNKAAVYAVYKDGEKMDIMVKSGTPAIGFFTYSVDDSTGKYNLTKVASGAYSCTVDSSTLNIYSKKYVNLGDGVTDAVLASDCTFYDTTDNNIIDLETLVTFVESNSGASFVLHALYDSKDEEITCIYLI